MQDKIDYKFLSELEGGCRISGYVPAAAVSKSGVTIATGFDLGQRHEKDLAKLGIPEALLIKLKPYLGKKGKDAADYLRKYPLKITKDQGSFIDKAVKASHVNSLKTKYFSSPHNITKLGLFDIPGQAQTVIASVSFQYGINLDVSAPKFWTSASSQNWKETVAILKFFADAYPTRRNKEAALLGQLLK